MRRRDFIAGLGLAAAQWPFLARAEPRVARIGYLSPLSAEDWDKALIEAHAVLHRDHETVVELGREILMRYGTPAPDESALDVVRAQATKRVGLQFVPARVASWDHRKLGGVY